MNRVELKYHLFEHDSTPKKSILKLQPELVDLAILELALNLSILELGLKLELNN